MKITINDLPKSQKEIKIQFESDDLLPFENQALDQLGADITIPGYRPGKAPSNLLRNKISELKIDEKAAVLAIEKKYPQIIKENKLKAIGYPDITITKIVPKKIVEMTIITSVIPNITLPDYKNIAAHTIKDSAKIEISSKEINDALKWLQKSRSKLEKTDKLAKKGNIVTIDYSVTDEETGKELDKKNNYVFVLGQEVIPSALEDKIKTTPLNANTIIHLPPSDKWQQKTFIGKKLKVNYTITSIKQIVSPELDDKFAKTIGPFSTIEELKENIKKGLEQEKQRKGQEKWRLNILDKIIEEVKNEIPDILVTTELDKIIAELKDQANRMHLTFDQYLKQIKKTEDDVKKDLLPLAEKRAKASLILKEIANKEAITVSPEEIDKKSQELLQQIPSESKNKINTDNLKSFSEGLLRSEKVFQFLEKLSSPAKTIKSTPKPKK